MESVQCNIWTASVKLSSWQRTSLRSIESFLSQSSHFAIHVIEQIIVHSDNMVQCDFLPLRYPQGPISEWPLHFHDLLHIGAFILGCEEWLMIAVFWVCKPVKCEFM